MGMFSEISASYEAEALSKVIETAFKTKDSNILFFVEQHILPLYTAAAWESWDQDLVAKIEIYKAEFEKLSDVSSTKRGPV